MKPRCISATLEARPTFSPSAPSHRVLVAAKRCGSAGSPGKSCETLLRRSHEHRAQPASGLHRLATARGRLRPGPDSLALFPFWAPPLKTSLHPHVGAVLTVCLNHFSIEAAEVIPVRDGETRHPSQKTRPVGGSARSIRLVLWLFRWFAHTARTGRITTRSPVQTMPSISVLGDAFWITCGVAC